MLGDERASFVRTISGLQLWLGIALAVPLTVGVWVFSAGGGGWGLAAGSGIALLGAWLREFRRGVALLEGRNGAASIGDALFALLACTAVLGMWASAGSVSAGGMLAATGAAAGAAGVLGFPGLAGARSAGTRRRVVRVVLDQAKWSLPGTAVAWGQSSGYAYVAGLLLGSGAVGEIAATRLFVVPLLLVGVAWSRMFLPRAAALLANGSEASLRTSCRRAMRDCPGGLGGLCGRTGARVRTWTRPHSARRVRRVCGAGSRLDRLRRGQPRAVDRQQRAHRWPQVPRVVRHDRRVGHLRMTLVLVLMIQFEELGAIIGLTAGELLMGILCWRALLARRGN